MAIDPDIKARIETNSGIQVQASGEVRASEKLAAISHKYQWLGVHKANGDLYAKVKDLSLIHI